jgi:hypothetical protein
MGYVRHNAIIATAWQEGAAEALVAYAAGIGADAIAGPEVINGYRTVVVVPDGSKEGWSNSNEGDERRQKIRAWLESEKYYWEWAEVAYGDDPANAEVVEHKWSESK